MFGKLNRMKEEIKARDGCGVRFSLADYAFAESVNFWRVTFDEEQRKEYDQQRGIKRLKTDLFLDGEKFGEVVEEMAMRAPTVPSVSIHVPLPGSMAGVPADVMSSPHFVCCNTAHGYERRLEFATLRQAVDFACAARNALG